MKLFHALRHHDLGPFAGSGSRSGALAALGVASSRAIYELALARIAFARLTMAEVQARNDRAVASPASGEEALVERVAFVIPRVAARLPWRSDCLPQAMAAQNWLRSSGIASRIEIGVETASPERFGAHAWLKHGETVVTGGEIADYATIFGGRSSA